MNIQLETWVEDIGVKFTDINRKEGILIAELEVNTNSITGIDLAIVRGKMTRLEAIEELRILIDNKLSTLIDCLE